jgi:hypothetical protein
MQITRRFIRVFALSFIILQATVILTANYTASQDTTVTSPDSKQMERLVLPREAVDTIVIKKKFLDKEWSIMPASSAHFEISCYYEEPRTMAAGGKIFQIPGKQNARSRGAYRYTLIRIGDKKWINPEDDSDIKYEKNKNKEYRELYIGFHAVYSEKPEASVREQMKRFEAAVNDLSKASPLFLEHRMGTEEGYPFTELKLIARGDGQLARIDRVYYLSEQLICRIYVEYSAQTAEYEIRNVQQLIVTPHDQQKEDPKKSIAEAQSMMDKLAKEYLLSLKKSGNAAGSKTGK